ncbi:MAG: glycosyltransferase family 39 protein [Polyangiales bacterium]
MSVPPLGRRSALVAIIALTAIFYLPALLGGYLADDHFHLFLLGDLPEKRVFSLFSFVKSPSEITVLRNWGVVPWWTSDALRIDFFRPIPSLTHALDYRLFGRDPVAAHLVSIGWYLVALALVARVYRRFLPEGSRLVLLAVAVFALDDTHALVVQWLANRADLIGAVFLLTALLAWLRLLERPNVRDRVIVVVAFVLALLSKESSVILPALLFAHDRRRERRLQLVVAGVAVAWLALYLGDGHGPSSVYYLNPSRDFGGWAAGLFRAGLFHAVILVTNTPLHVFSSAPLEELPGLSAACLCATFAFFVLAWKLLRHDRASRFFFAWTLLTLAILTTTFPDPRLLMLPSVGFAFLVARVAQELHRRSALWARSALVVVLTLHLLVAPLLDQVCLAVVGRLRHGYDDLRAGMEGAIDYGHLPASPDDGIEVFFLTFHPREASALATFWLARNLQTADAGPVLARPDLAYVDKIDRSYAAMKVRYHALSFLGEREDVDVDVLDDRTLEIAPKTGNFLPTLFEQLYLTTTRFEVGQTVALPSFTARVVAIDRAGLPTRVRFVFPRSLSSPRYRFIAWDGRRFSVVSLGGAGRIALRSP